MIGGAEFKNARFSICPLGMLHINCEFDGGPGYAVFKHWLRVYEYEDKPDA